MSDTTFLGPGLRARFENGEIVLTSSRGVDPVIALDRDAFELLARYAERCWDDDGVHYHSRDGIGHMR